MFHPDTQTVGVVVDSVHPPDNKLEQFEQVLLLADGTRRQFRLLELYPATSVAIEKFWETAVFGRFGCTPFE